MEDIKHSDDEAAHEEEDKLEIKNPYVPVSFCVTVVLRLTNHKRKRKMKRNRNSLPRGVVGVIQDI